MSKPTVNGSGNMPAEVFPDAGYLLATRFACMRLSLWESVAKRVFIEMRTVKDGWVGAKAVSEVIDALKQYVVFSTVSRAIERLLKKADAADVRECIFRMYQLTDKELVHRLVTLYREDTTGRDDIERLLSRLRAEQSHAA